MFRQDINRRMVGGQPKKIETVKTNRPAKNKQAASISRLSQEVFRLTTAR